MERIGIYGGTFNPIHRGHIHLAREIQAALQFDRLLFIPSRIPPHKEAKQLASGQDRLEMVRLALEEELPEAMVSDLELKSRGKSYTFYTLEKLQALLPDSAFTLIMGTDMLLTFDQWFRWRDILSMACLAVAARNAGEQQLMEKKARALSPEGRITVVPMTPLPMSSTDVRRIIRTGGDPSALLPEKVWAYIRDRGLYQ
ncbi:MAG: nicotinate (nicotinamide) nucleotide adenylyltransferase [Oscillospiraceae bacterium]|nr:nicotinate (nicotinamide) nucleotide adenylyltransferase [Oscillospiraceae bacterium]